ncbi:M14 family metallopeptidase [Sphingobacterium griseoflavum]|uniref:Peptidase M14 domain-containing protein n=1 Tax=Sphingobacterium griseoflavum TaxID=1474952 RepID=A0ABQ3HZL2_9SPHI|nr:M14 family metallopeptidase [Sphingobacterium griseoflavum]GHE41366.1 hypothetical protein GCM10017764_25930 [Sphingobacterium griseoflavum]
MKISIFLFFVLLPFAGRSQLNYPTYGELTEEIRAISKHAGGAASSIGRSYGGEDISVIKIQSGAEKKPTLLIVAGIDGKHPAGIISALDVAKNILNLPQDSLAAILSKRSVWIVPVLNPDAYKRNVASNRWLSGNARVIDNDRDGRLNEDPAEDLNRDGVIAQMRVRRKGGKYVAHSDHNDYLIEADRSKGQEGIYELYIEGIDADKDGLFGEDGDGGVNIDRNFTYDYRPFTAESGDYAASEPETRALVDFIFDHPQIASVLHFGLGNNLTEAESFDARKAGERIISSWSAKDVDAAKFVSSVYNRLTANLGVAPKSVSHGGGFSNTAYYHLGKYSFVTPVWWPAVQDTSQIGKASGAKNGDDMFLQWIATNKLKGAILPWAKINHADFPQHSVEVGGVVEVFKNNPPKEFLQLATRAHTDFVVALLHNMARLEFETPVVTPLGDDIFRIDIRVVNTGVLATYPEIADKIKHVSKMKAVCSLQKNQKFLSGKRLQLYPTLAGGASQQFSWLIQGKGSVEITAGCPTAGEQTIKINL